MTNIKEKISERKNLIIAGALIAIMAIGSTFAYFVDRDQVTNHFTVGDIEISVSEPNWNPRAMRLLQRTRRRFRMRTICLLIRTL